MELRSAGAARERRTRMHDAVGRPFLRGLAYGFSLGFLAAAIVSQLGHF